MYTAGADGHRDAEEGGFDGVVFCLLSKVLFHKGARENLGERAGGDKAEEEVGSHFL